MPSHQPNASISRRHALQGLGAASLVSAFGTALASGSELPHAPANDAAAAPFHPSDWNSVRAQFLIDRSWVHMSGLLFASHPAPVRASIEALRRRFDANPTATVHEEMPQAEEATRSALADYFGVDAADLALTDSTTMGLGILYGGLKLNPGDEVLTSEHDHYSTHSSLEGACARSGAKLTKVRLYERGQDFNTEAATTALAAAITPNTRAVALTWVHSSTGVRLPLPAFAAVIAKANAGRDANQRILFCVDGVHGTGVEDLHIPDLGCDFFVAGTHKWLFGPRGTGILWGRPSAQSRVVAIIPSFSALRQSSTWGRHMTPGGFHTYEYRWSVGAASRFHQTIGKQRVQQRIHALASQMKEGLANIKGLVLHTPKAPELSAGLVCFEIDGLQPTAIVEALAKRRIIASTTPYAVSYARVTPSLLNDPTDVVHTIQALTQIARGRRSAAL